MSDKVANYLNALVSVVASRKDAPTDPDLRTAVEASSEHFIGSVAIENGAKRGGPYRHRTTRSDRYLSYDILSNRTLPWDKVHLQHATISKNLLVASFPAPWYPPRKKEYKKP